MSDFEKEEYTRLFSTRRREFGSFVKSIFRGLLPSAEETELDSERSMIAARKKGQDYRSLLPTARSIAVFHYGTCVFSERIISPAEAEMFVRVHGPVEITTASADFSVEQVQAPRPGLLIRYHHPNMIHFEADGDSQPPTAGQTPLVSGIILRASRDMDAAHPRIIYFWNENAGERLDFTP